ncbi:MAG: ABC transporter permease [Actinomycetota bacterium]|nr:ABC transporter permease [Actinomycetota bacterium]
MRILRSEFLKLVSVRTTWLLLGGMLLIEGLYAGLVAGLVSENKLRGRDVSQLLAGTPLTTVFVFTLGALLATNEFRHGTANSTFVITPQRERVIAAKLAVGFVAGLVAALQFIAINAGLGLAVLSSRNVPVEGDTAVNIYIGVGIGMILACMFGVGLGATLRNQIVTVVTGLAVFFVLRGIALLLGDPGTYFPAESLAALQGAVGRDFLLSQVDGGLVFGGYCVFFAVAGITLARFREIT